MELRILVDTNILLDYLLDREPHENQQGRLLKPVSKKRWRVALLPIL